MKISQELIDEMVAHAREDLPNECCGMVGGTDERARTVYPARNEFASPLSFQVHSDDQFRVMHKEMPARGEDLLAIYHSHTKSAAYPSQTDLNQAEHWPEPLYIIVSFEDPDVPDVKGFWLRNKTIEEAELVVS